MNTKYTPEVIADRNHDCMSQRQWYKGMALQGMLAANTVFSDTAVKIACKLADELIKEDTEHFNKNQ